eukprot:1804532-Rhodomonas_salina.7
MPLETRASTWRSLSQAVSSMAVTPSLPCSVYDAAGPSILDPILTWSVRRVGASWDSICVAVPTRPPTDAMRLPSLACPRAALHSTNVLENHNVRSHTDEPVDPLIVCASCPNPLPTINTNPPPNAFMFAYPTRFPLLSLTRTRAVLGRSYDTMLVNDAVAELMVSTTAIHRPRPSFTTPGPVLVTVPPGGLHSTAVFENHCVSKLADPPKRVRDETENDPNPTPVNSRVGPPSAKTLEAPNTNFPSPLDNEMIVSAIVGRSWLIKLLLVPSPCIEITTAAPSGLTVLAGEHERLESLIHTVVPAADPPALTCAE